MQKTFSSFADLMKAGKALKQQALELEAQRKREAEAADKRSKEAREDRKSVV